MNTKNKLNLLITVRQSRGVPRQPDCRGKLESIEVKLFVNREIESRTHLSPFQERNEANASSPRENLWEERSSQVRIRFIEHF